MTIQSAQQLPIKIFPQKDQLQKNKEKKRKNNETKQKTVEEKKGFCVRLINCFAHVFRAKCLPERINPTNQLNQTHPVSQQQ